jgi:hypothetical protein
MADPKDERELHGWDDGTIYFWDETTSKEFCVNDEPELFAKLVQTCREWYGRGR